MVTRNFIKEFQGYRELIPDGIAGKNTLKELKKYLSIEDNICLGHFFAVCKYESENFIGTGRENLNYSAKSLVKNFPKYFKSLQVAKLYERQPEKIANYIYANRMGNNRLYDGYYYRGIGAIQLTGRMLITECMEKLDISPKKDIEILLLPSFYFKSAKFYFDKFKLWDLCRDTEKETVLTIARAVNIGDKNSNLIPFGMKERYKAAEEVFNLLKL